MSSSRPSHGNFQRYYSIRGATKSGQEKSTEVGVRSEAEARQQQQQQQQHTVSEDPRLTLLLQHLEAKGVEPRRILDIGCNTGRFTCALAQRLPQAHVYGVDIDASLIRGAAAHARSLGLATAASAAASAAASPSRPAKRARTDESSTPHAPVFRHADWPRASLDLQQVKTKLDVPTGLEQEERRVLQKQLEALEAVLRDDDEGWDLICALSITKWIHLAHSDAGLRLLFARIASSLNPGGVLLLEPQPWKSYEQARRVIGKEGRGIHRGLTLRPEDFEWVLSRELGLEGKEELGLTEGYGFKRPLHLYIQPQRISDKVKELRQAVLRQGASFAFVSRPFRPPKVNATLEAA